LRDLEKSASVGYVKSPPRFSAQFVVADSRSPWLAMR